MAKKKVQRRKKVASLFDDPWIKEWSVIGPAKEHALGIITLGWNSCELHLLVLFVMVARIEPRQGWIIAHDLGNIPLADRILEIAKYRVEEQQLPPAALEAIRYALRVFNICRQNRNTFTHFKTDTKPNGERYIVRMKGPSMYRDDLPNDLEAFRRVAEEIRGLAMHLLRLWECIERINKGVQASLPTKPVLPELLWKPSQPQR